MVVRAIQYCSGNRESVHAQYGWTSLLSIFHLQLAESQGIEPMHAGLWRAECTHSLIIVRIAQCLAGRK